MINYLLLMSLDSNGQTPPNDKNWNTTPFFEDQFNSFNSALWTKDLGWGRTQAAWNFSFEDANVTISNGKLIHTTTQNFGSGKPIHSGAITTKQSDFLYGYFEINCKLNSLGLDYMPAFWVWNSHPTCDCDGLPPSDQCTWYDELDFFEGYSTNPSNLGNITVSSNVHKNNNTCNTASYHDESLVNSTVTTQFHTYGFEWSPGFVISYFDGVPYRFFRSSDVASHALRLVANLGFRVPISTNLTFPGKMEIEYIKVLKLKMDPTVVINSCSFVPSTFNYSVKKSITLGQAGTCSNSLSTNDKVTLRATDYVCIYGDFTVPINSEFTILPTPGY